MANGYVERDVTRFNAFSKSFEIFQNSGNHKPRVSIANLGFRNEPQDVSDYGFLRYIYILFVCACISDIIVYLYTTDISAVSPERRAA